jgi:hypothetical protein
MQTGYQYDEEPEQECEPVTENAFQVNEQKVERATMMIVRDNPPRDAPEPFNAIGIRIIGRRID